MKLLKAAGYIVFGLAAIYSGIFTLTHQHIKTQQCQPAAIPKAPADYPQRIVDCGGQVYFVKTWNFDDQHKCVIFQDYKGDRRMVCGSYKIESVANSI